MAQADTVYKQIRPEDVITDAQLRKSLSALDEPWQPERARFRMASALAVGLLVLFALTVGCNGTVMMTLIIAWAVKGTGGDNMTDIIDKMLQLITTVIPYIATPLGVALGFFFRDAREG